MLEEPAGEMASTRYVYAAPAAGAAGLPGVVRPVPSSVNTTEASAVVASSVPSR